MMRVGIIGACGHVGTVFAPVGTPFEFADIASGGRPDDTARALAQAKGIPFYEDWRALLGAVDAVAVNTVFSDNAAIAAEALRRGVAVYCEKPAATTWEGLRLVEAAARESGTPLFSMLTMRFDPWFAEAKRLCGAGAIGRPRLVTGQKSYRLGTRPAFYSDRALYGGTIPWIGIHVIDLALWMTGLSCGEISGRHSREANGGNGTMESAAAVEMTLSGGVPARLSMDYLRPENAPSHGDDRIRIAGDEGVLEVRGERVYLINRENDCTEPVPVSPEEPIFEHFLRYVQNPECRNAPEYRDIDALEATRIALCARDDADAHML